jgi:hypothetical protein
MELIDSLAAFVTWMPKADEDLPESMLQQAATSATSFSFNKMDYAGVRSGSFRWRSPLFVICYHQERRPGQFVDSSFRSSFFETSCVFCNLQT